jgi:hypothetical protein
MDGMAAIYLGVQMLICTLLIASELRRIARALEKGRP